MTGGGSILGSRTTHGFTLHCDPAALPNQLEVNWGGNYFRLEELVTVRCSDDPALEPASPGAPFDTYEATGTGILNGDAGATASWVFTDNGQPGTRDYAKITIEDAAGDQVLATGGYLQFGNHQAGVERPSAAPAGWFHRLTRTVRALLLRELT